MPRLPHKMTTEISKMWRLPRQLQPILCKRRKSIAPATQNDSRHVIKQVGTSQSAAPATQNGMTTCFDTFEKERICNFPYLDTARPQENQRLETRHVAASNRAFRARLPQFFTLCSFKIDVLLWVATSKSMFRARLPSIFITPHKITEIAPCRHLTQPCQCDSQKTRNTTRLKCCACHAKWRWTRPKCCACHESCNTSSENVAKFKSTVLRLPHKTIFDTLPKTLLNVTKCRACHAKRSNATCETSKTDPFGNTYHRHGQTGIARTVADGCGRLRTVADGCGRLRTVADGCGRLGNVERTQWNGNPYYAFRKTKWHMFWHAMWHIFWNSLF